MSLIEIFQIAPTLSSLNDTQKSHLDKIQLGICPLYTRSVSTFHPMVTTLFCPCNEQQAFSGFGSSFSTLTISDFFIFPQPIYALPQSL